MITPIDPNEYEELGEVYLEALVEGESGFMAVARAVLPEGYVAVPVEVIEESANALQKVASGQITGNNHSHRPWAQKRADAIRSLLPTESEATR